MMLPFLISVNEVENVSREMAEWWNDPVSTVLFSFTPFHILFHFPVWEGGISGIH